MPEQQQIIPVKKGRPTKYSKSIVKDILDKLSRGISIRDAVKECGITWQSWRNWILKDEKLREGYIKAKELGISTFQKKRAQVEAEVAAKEAENA